MTQPVPRSGIWNSRIPRSAWGHDKKARVQAEKAYSRTFEETLQLHRLDFWHCTVAQRSQPGWPDYVVLGDGWLAFVELKARSPATNKIGKLMPEQYRFKDAIEKAGGEWRSFILPDEWRRVDAWLNGHTEKNIWGSGT